MELYRNRKILFLVIAVFIVFSVISAETLIASEHDHDCTGEGCPVCLQIEIVKCFLRTFNLIVFFSFLAAFHEFFAAVYRVFNGFFHYIFSLVTLKVRFNT